MKGNPDNEPRGAVQVGHIHHIHRILCEPLKSDIARSRSNEPIKSCPPKEYESHSKLGLKCPDSRLAHTYTLARKYYMHKFMFSELISPKITF